VQVDENLKRWCGLLGIQAAAVPLAGELQRLGSGWLNVEVATSARNPDEIDVTVIATRPCYVQVYEYTEIRGEPVAVLGMLEDMPMDYPDDRGGTVEARLLKPEEPLKLELKSPGTNKPDYLVLARDAKLGEPDQDLLALLKEQGSWSGAVLKGWAIAGTEKSR
jgi:hypothetical protein